MSFTLPTLPRLMQLGTWEVIPAMPPASYEVPGLAWYWEPQPQSAGARLCFVAHIDTVWPGRAAVRLDTKTQTYYSGDRWGCGADDRAGVWAAMELRSRLGAAVLLTNWEEQGGRGARAAAADPELRRRLKWCDFLVELDRRGRNDWVRYTPQPAWVPTIMARQGWVEACGSFSDISILGPSLRIASVNVSIGYAYEHTPQELLHWPTLWRNVYRLETLWRHWQPKQRLPKPPDD